MHPGPVCLRRSVRHVASHRRPLAGRLGGSRLFWHALHRSEAPRQARWQTHGERVRVAPLCLGSTKQSPLQSVQPRLGRTSQPSCTPYRAGPLNAKGVTGSSIAESFARQLSPHVAECRHRLPVVLFSDDALPSPAAGAAGCGKTGTSSSRSRPAGQPSVLVKHRQRACFVSGSAGLAPRRFSGDAMGQPRDATVRHGPGENMAAPAGPPASAIPPPARADRNLAADRPSDLLGPSERCAGVAFCGVQEEARWWCVTEPGLRWVIKSAPTDYRPGG